MEGYKKNGKKRSKPAVSFDKNREKLEFYKSADHAGRELNISHRGISEVCIFHSLGYNKEEWYKNHKKTHANAQENIPTVQNVIGDTQLPKKLTKKLQVLIKN